MASSNAHSATLSLNNYDWKSSELTTILCSQNLNKDGPESELLVIYDCQPTRIKLIRPKSRFARVLMLTKRKVGSGEEIETNVAKFQLTITKHAHINVLSSGGCEFMICENTTKCMLCYACYSSCNQLYEKCAWRIIQKNKPGPTGVKNVLRKKKFHILEYWSFRQNCWRIYF